MAKPADVCLAYASSGPVLSAIRAILTGPLSAASAGALQRPARAAPKAIQCSFIIFSWSSTGPRSELLLARRTEVCAAPCVFVKILTIVFRYGAQHDLDQHARCRSTATDI